MGDEKNEWMRNMFTALSTKQISRNKNFTLLASGWHRQVFRRFRIVCALQREAERLSEIPGSQCWVNHDKDGLHFHLSCPALQYQRVVPLHSHEWEWLGRQRGVQDLLTSESLEGGTAV